MSHQEQVQSKEFFNQAKNALKDEYKWINNELITDKGGPSWVREAVSALNGNGTYNIISGTNKVVVIKNNNVYTLEILSQQQMLQKERVYKTLGEIPEKIQIKLPSAKFNILFTEKVMNRMWEIEEIQRVLHFAKTEYCDDIMTILEKNVAEFDERLWQYNTSLIEQIILLMETYKILCDHNIYLIDIKPDNMIFCSDGLYFIDVDDITITRHPEVIWSFITTPAYESKDWRAFRRKAFNSEENKYSLPDIQTRYEYEGWQALIKTYFCLKFKFLFNYRDVAFKLNEQHNTSFEDMFLIKTDELWLNFIVSPDDYVPIGFREYILQYYEKKNDIREWLNSASVDNKENVAGVAQNSLSSRIQLRF